MTNYPYPAKWEEDIECPRVIENAIRINKAIQTRAKKRAKQECTNTFIDRIELGVGPINCGGVSIFAHDGVVENHKDDAGHTYGLVLYAEEDRYLIAEDKKLLLRTGSAYHLNSDEMHSAEGNGLIIIATHDYFHDRHNRKKPDMPLEDYAAWAMEEIRKYL